LVYVFFFGVFLYAIGFVENVLVPKSIDSGAAGGLFGSILINLALLGVFAVQHSVMARPAFKRALAKYVPPEAERSTFVLMASLALALLFWQWRPLPQTVWLIEAPATALFFTALSWVGWGMVLLSTFLISHFHLFGVSQGFARVLGLKEAAPHFVTPLLYKHLRHPIYAGFIIAFWAAPHMTLGHLVFSIATTGYIFVGVFLEERDLAAFHGRDFARYREQVPAFIPFLRRRRDHASQASAQ
jgi:protein-S-isoprenylcysteine O-methyltransferase Ste14